MVGCVNPRNGWVCFWPTKNGQQGGGGLESPVTLEKWLVLTLNTGVMVDLFLFRVMETPGSLPPWPHVEAW